jgi:hypothetical protein
MITDSPSRDFNEVSEWIRVHTKPAHDQTLDLYLGPGSARTRAVLSRTRPLLQRWAGFRSLSRAIPPAHIDRGQALSQSWTSIIFFKQQSHHHRPSHLLCRPISWKSIKEEKL